MNAVSFLLDEHVPLIVRSQLALMQPEVQVYAIGDGLAPPRGSRW